MRRVFVPSLLIPTVLAVTAAHAQTAQERQWCESEDEVTVSQRLDGCSAVIKAGRDRSDKLAEAYSSRGLAYRNSQPSDNGIGAGQWKSPANFPICRKGLPSNGTSISQRAYLRRSSNWQ